METHNAAAYSLCPTFTNPNRMTHDPMRDLGIVNSTGIIRKVSFFSWLTSYDYIEPVEFTHSSQVEVTHYSEDILTDDQLVNEEEKCKTKTKRTRGGGNTSS